MSQIDLNTVLLTIVLALCGWTLVEVHRHAVTLGRLVERVSGTDGSGGHAGEIARLRADLEILKGALVDIRAVLRMKRRRNEALAADIAEEGAE